MIKTIGMIKNRLLLLLFGVLLSAAVLGLVVGAFCFFFRKGILRVIFGTVEADVMEHDGEVGHIFITDKLLNGFKVRYDGSAKSATVRLIIKGGM